MNNKIEVFFFMKFMNFYEICQMIRYNIKEL